MAAEALSECDQIYAAVLAWAPIKMGPRSRCVLLSRTPATVLVH